MKRNAHTLRETYRTALRRHLRDGTAASLRPAQPLGRRAVALEVDTLTLARIHDEAPASAGDPRSRASAADRDRIARRAGDFVAEALLPWRPPNLGMLEMRERVEMVGGKLTLESTPGRGTTLQVQVPFVNRR